ncbi:SDR family NAD(P)-dependent oxidoreductase [Streptomyces sp. NPDC004166]|uniref:SDR family NAD(P)-dependent oxidoreductase n=1 Tax=Streptomyces sp. NPDC091299 TaxID=3155302 RepID=UPI003445C2A8
MATQDSITGRTVLVTGANRGIGRALVDEALRRDAGRVYAGMRQPFTHPDNRVTALSLDVTDHAQIQAAADSLDSLDVLVNNAGLAIFDDLTDPAMLKRHLAVNLFGTYAVTQAVLPHLTASRGTVVNLLSTASITSVPVMPAYSISKAAAFSLTQALRALLAERGVRVHAVLAGPVDTDMSRDLNIPKASPTSVAQAILDGVTVGQEEIFPDPVSAILAADWPTGPVKILERENTALLAGPR